MSNPFYTRVYNAIPFTFAKSGPLNTEFGRLQTSFDLIDAALTKYPGNDTVYVVGGNVGIGTASPGAKLEVRGSAPAAAPVWNAVDTLIVSAISSNVIQLHAGDASGSMAYSFSYGTNRGRGAMGYIPATDAMYFATAGTERMLIDSGGKVMIGTTSGLRTLNIRNTADAFSSATITTAATGTAVGNSTLYFGNGSNDALCFIDRDNTAGSLAFGTAGSERMRIDTAGNLLIGTAAAGSSAAAVVCLANAIAPTSSPAGVGQLYVEAGALKYRGSSGTVTILAPA